MRPEQPLCRLVVALLAVAGTLATTAPAQDSAEQVAILTAARPEAGVLVFGEQTTIGVEQFVYPDEPLPIGFSGPVDQQQAIFQLDGLGVTLVLSAAEVELSLHDGGGLSVDVTAAEPGAWLAIVHSSSAPLAVLNLPAASVGVPRAAIRAELVTGDAWQIATTAGKVSLETQSGQTVALRADHVVRVSADGELGAPGAEAGLLARLSQDQQAIVQASLLPDFVRVAEAVAEGDIEPPTRAGRVLAAVVAPVVEVKEIVPRGGLASRIQSRSIVATAGAPTRSTAEAFIGSGEAALAVVGARLQRTRVVGTSGLFGRSLSISRDLSLPFLLRPLVR